MQRPSGIHTPRRPSGVAEVPRAAKSKRSGASLLAFTLLLIGGASAAVFALGGPGPAWVWLRERLGADGAAPGASIDQDAAATSAKLKDLCAAGDFRAATALLADFSARHAGQAALARHQGVLKQEIREAARVRAQEHEAAISRLIAAAQAPSYVQAIELHASFLQRWGDLSGVDANIQESVQGLPEAVVDAACSQARKQRGGAAWDLLGQLDRAVRTAQLDPRLSVSIGRTMNELGDR